MGSQRVRYHSAIKQQQQYSTGNSTQYSVMTFIRRESKQEWIYVNWLISLNLVGSGSACVCVCVCAGMDTCVCIMGVSIWVGSWGVGLSHPVWTRPAQPCATCLARLVKSLDWKGLLSYFLAQHWYLGLPRWLSAKESACQAGDLGWITRSGRSPEEGNDNPLQYSCLRNPMDRGAWRATVGLQKSWTQLSD